MQVQHDNAAQAERIVLDYLRAHGPTTMERLVRAVVGLSWAQVFSAVDRLSRANKIHLGQTPHRDYTIRMRDAFIPRHVLTQTISAKEPNMKQPNAMSQ
jgi:hypothetical protein